MALYRWVPDVDELGTLVVDRVVWTIPAVRDRGGLAADLMEWARGCRAVLAASPGLAGRLLGSWFDSVAMLGCVEDLLARVGFDGIEGFRAVAVVNAVLMHVLMRVEAERTVRAAGAVRRSLKIATSERPLPLLEALQHHYTTAEFETHFEFGLEALVHGLALPSRPAR
jgi:Tetracyclin repressor-like, C-terminal domain